MDEETTPLENRDGNDRASSPQERANIFGKRALELSKRLVRDEIKPEELNQKN